MTGYGRGEATTEEYHVVVETRSVNSRYLEVSVRMPRHTSPLEERVKKQVQAFLTRGKVDIFINLEEKEKKNKELQLDQELCFAYYNSLVQAAEICGIEPKIDLALLTNLPGIFTLEKQEDDLEALWLVISEALIGALENLAAMREAEGEKLTADLSARGETITRHLEEIRQQAPKVVEHYQTRLQERLNDLLSGDIPLDPVRLATEVAIFADKCAIDEEIIRLDSHLSQFSKMLTSNEAIGRKLDFLLQEMNREINTIGSKANDLLLSHIVIDVKAELEKIREQVQNIE